jgi:bifunctional non-homologous end joining protein LigD
MRSRAEGVVSKRADAPYRSGRTEAWIKVKAWQRDRLAVVGFVPEGSSGLLKLRLARREGDALGLRRPRRDWLGSRDARTIRRALAPLARRKSPLSEPLQKADTTWVEPRHDADVVYAEITDDGTVRHPSFRGLSEAS